MISENAIRDARSFRECIRIYEEAIAYLKRRKGTIASTAREIREFVWKAAEEAVSKALNLAVTEAEIREIITVTKRHKKSRERFRDLYQEANKKMREVA